MTGRVVRCPIDEMNKPWGRKRVALRIPSTDAEIAALFAGWREELVGCREFAPSARDYVAAKLMSRVGLRVNEARTLDLADVKLTRTTSSTSADPLDVVTHHVRPHVATTVCPTLLHRHLQRRQHPITGSSPTPKPDSL